MPDLINWSNSRNANQQVPILTLAVKQAISMQAGKADLWPDALYILLMGCCLADTRTPRREEDCAAGRSDNCTTNLFLRGQTHFSFSLAPKVLKIEA